MQDFWFAKSVPTDSQGLSRVGNARSKLLNA